MTISVVFLLILSNDALSNLISRRSPVFLLPILGVRETELIEPISSVPRVLRLSFRTVSDVALLGLELSFSGVVYNILKLLIWV